MITPSNPSQDPFAGISLTPDPAIALEPPLVTPAGKGGPIYRVQFVVEFVGPRSIASGMALHLLNPTWLMPLGQPYSFAMRSSDLTWQVLTPNLGGAYDSLCLAWDMVTPKGTLSHHTSQNLLKVAEDFATHIQRRAMPLPPPSEVARNVQGLLEMKEHLDVGFSISVAARSGQFLERDLWIECARLGLTFGNGSFDLVVPGHAFPLLSVTPYGITDAFSLRSVQNQATHPGVTIGFHLPISIAPIQALDGCFNVANHLAQRLGGLVFDEDDRPMVDRSRKKIYESMREAMTLFSQAGVVPGSAAMIRLFGFG